MKTKLFVTTLTFMSTLSSYASQDILHCVSSDTRESRSRHELKVSEDNGRYTYSYTEHSYSELGIPDTLLAKSSGGISPTLYNGRPTANFKGEKISIFHLCGRMKVFVDAVQHLNFEFNDFECKELGEL